MAMPTAAEIASALDGKRSGNGWSARCPAHDDANPSLSISTGEDGRTLLHCHAGCSQDTVIDALRRRGLWSEKTPQRPEATKYPYCRADGTTLVTVARTGSGKGKDVWREPKGVKRPQGGYPLYRLPSLLANGDKPLLVVEGEKAAEAAHHLFGDRYEATTSIGGVEKGPHSDWTPARGRQVVIWPDADGKGRDHGAEVAGLCHAAGAAGVRMVETAQLPDGWDLADRAPDGFDIEQAVSDSVSCPAPYRAEQSQKRSGGAWVTMAELLEGGDDIDSWVVDDMLPSGGLSMLSAKPKAGKSTMARCLALAIARGEPWLGRAVVGGAVLYLALEEKRSAVRAHFQAMGATADDNVVSRFGPAPDEALAARQTG